MIEIKSFSKKYSSHASGVAVKDFSMTCRKGEITGILGLNGAGKTTVLKAICGRHFATSGEILVDGVNVSENPEKVRNLTGFVAEVPQFPEEFTVSEYLLMCAQLHGIKKIPSLKNLSLEELLPKKIRTLSKGQRERVNFAQALIYEPSVLVLDEPASGLDPAQIINMRNLIKSLKNDHTIILSTHLMQEVESLCDFVYIIHNGRLAASGTKEDIASSFCCKNLEEAFFKITSDKGAL
ncbi:ABC transporter ATP-binding protein [uncultured Treponema sp.]|uniref:ABC transporter ATP-binding protein n=1 Tax=uncultured Treponema sp. TaxID=162155 RepID=UPI0025CFD5CF|nr:ABC transporter ATP-binding protein [uncultured Treponema sp.]